MSGATTVACFASKGRTGSQVSELPAMPWISTTTGPSPAVRYPIELPCRVSARASIKSPGSGYVGVGYGSVGSRSRARELAALEQAHVCFHHVHSENDVYLVMPHGG